MLVLNKKSKIFLYIIIFVLLVLGGFAVEHFEKDAFVMETVATEDYIPYESDTKEVADGKIFRNQYQFRRYRTACKAERYRRENV